VKISATIITFNEADKIARAINSLTFADEIIVIDSESTDDTVKIAENLGAKVIRQKWLGFSTQKQLATDTASNDWIFSLDADEIVSDELIEEIKNLKSLKLLPSSDAFKIPRLSFYMNRPILHCGWYPDWQIRFFNRKKAKWKDVLIHESVEVVGKIEKLKGDIWHYSVENASHHHRMIGERYAPLAAKQMFENGKKTTKLKIATVGLTTFLQNYIIKLGFLDGLAGFVISKFAAHHAFLKHLLLYELQEKKH
jgi:glycosyltransferase involved in cell wall biosynthesis